MTNRLVVIVVFAAASLCVTRSAQAQLKYFGYVGSDTIGAGICTPSCSAEAQDHVNIAWLDGSIPPASVAAQIDSAASRGQRVIIDIQTLLFLKDPEKGYLRFRPDPSGLFQALMDGGVG